MDWRKKGSVGHFSVLRMAWISDNPLGMDFEMGVLDRVREHAGTLR